MLKLKWLFYQDISSNNILRVDCELYILRKAHSVGISLQLVAMIDLQLQQSQRGFFCQSSPGLPCRWMQLILKLETSPRSAPDRSPFSQSTWQPFESPWWARGGRRTWTWSLRCRRARLWCPRATWGWSWSSDQCPSCSRWTLQQSLWKSWALPPAWEDGDSRIKIEGDFVRFVTFFSVKIQWDFWWKPASNVEASSSNCLVGPAPHTTWTALTMIVLISKNNEKKLHTQALFPKYLKTTLVWDLLKAKHCLVNSIVFIKLPKYMKKTYPTAVVDLFEKQAGPVHNSLGQVNPGQTIRLEKQMLMLRSWDLSAMLASILKAVMSARSVEATLVFLGKQCLWISWHPCSTFWHWCTDYCP